MAPPPKGRAGAPSLAALKNALAAKAAAEEEARRQEEAERLRLEEEERRRQEETAKEEAERQARKERERLKKEELKKAGKLLSKSEKEKRQRDKQRLEQMMQAGLKVPSKEDSPKLAEERKKPVYERKKKAAPKTQENGVKEEVREEEVLDDWEAALGEEIENLKIHDDKTVDKTAEKSVNNTVERSNKTDEKSGNSMVKKKKQENTGPELRSPICCILGHVDTGKTKLLDCIRQTNVQEGEAGGITQQIGATYFPLDAILAKAAHLQVEGEMEFRVPGLLVIDTPGHESFANLRSRGSSLCNIAILVVDIMHGLEPQTLESINLLRQRKTPFIVALNKIDRLYGWKSHPGVSLEELVNQQDHQARREFEERVTQTIVAFAEQGLNAELFYRNADIRKFVCLVPTSAITGDGIPDMLHLLLSLTQRMMAESLRYLSESLECTVLEVKPIEGHGTTIDVILSNGVLREGERIAVCGINGPIVTNIRALLTPQPLRELRVKGQYVQHKQVKAALGVKIAAPDLDKAVPGSPLLVIKDPSQEQKARDAVMSDLTAIQEHIDRTGKGVHVQASTLGSLEALLVFLKESKIPVKSFVF